METPESLDKHQSLIEHLVELRIRVINSLYGVLVGFGVCYGFSEKIFDVLRRPIAPYLPTGGLIFTGPLDKFMAHIKLSFVVGIALSAPFWLYQTWLFVAPALYKKEKRYAVGFIFSGSVLFLLGILFTYFLILPMAFKFLMTYGGDIDKPMISISEYLSFITHMGLAFGATFEMPLIITTLGIIGIVNSKFLREKRRYAVMAMAIVSAIITPPDAFSMLAMLVPMSLLYELSIICVVFFEKKNNPLDQPND